LEDATALGTPSITELRIANNFWSFTLRYELIGIEIRFGFRKVSDANRIAYEPKRFYTDDLQFFAYFWGQRQDILNYQNPRYDDLSRLSYVARFNPKRDVEFHLSTKSPQTPWM